jgi:UDP:flavonoid glycosyltransferase YjiC (YdhE family)
VRRKHSHLPPLTNWPFDPKNDWQTPILYAFSPQVIPRPADWRDRVHITGYWFSEDPGKWAPDPHLTDFLENKPPPLSVVFGSTLSRDLDRITAMVKEALSISNQRGIFVGAKTVTQTTRSDFFQADYIPYDWLFKRSGAVIHHGGAGTTGKTLMAGVPNIILPFTSDQPFWGCRVYQLGAGPRPLSPKQLTVTDLVKSIETAIHSEAIRNRAADIAERLKIEDGVSQAVEIIHKYAEEKFR